MMRTASIGTIYGHGGRERERYNVCVTVSDETGVEHKEDVYFRDPHLNLKVASSYISHVQLKALFPIPLTLTLKATRIHVKILCWPGFMNSNCY